VALGRPVNSTRGRFFAYEAHMSNGPAKSLNNKSMKLYIAAWLLSSPSGSNKESYAPVLLSFSAPDYGIMFRCRVVCRPSEGMATAAVTGLRFLEVSLRDANFEEVVLCVDSPSYYFQITGQAAGAGQVGAKAEMLQKYRKKFKLDFKLVERVNNPARHHCLGLPTTPSDVKSPLTYNPLKWPQKGKMMSLQNGIEL
jgi:hypothetical protein